MTPRKEKYNNDDYKYDMNIIMMGQVEINGMINLFELNWCYFGHKYKYTDMMYK